MAGNRTRLLLIVLGIAVTLTAVPYVGGRAWAQGEERLLTYDLIQVPLEQALRFVFKDTPYSFTLAPGLEGRTVTLTLNDVTFSQALRAVLGMHDLTYRKGPGDIYEIIEQPEEITNPPPGPGEQDEDVIPARMNLYWFGPGGRYELQYLDCRLVAIWFGGRQIGSALTPMGIEGGGGVGGGRGGMGGLGGGGLGGGRGGLGGGMGGGGLGGLGGGGLGGGRGGGGIGGGRSGGGIGSSGGGGSRGGGGGGGGRGGGGGGGGMGGGGSRGGGGFGGGGGRGR